jgi:hypothetical protein
MATPLRQERTGSRLQAGSPSFGRLSWYFVFTPPPSDTNLTRENGGTPIDGAVRWRGGGVPLISPTCLFGRETELGTTDVRDRSRLPGGASSDSASHDSQRRARAEARRASGTTLSSEGPHDGDQCSPIHSARIASSTSGMTHRSNKSAISTGLVRMSRWDPRSSHTCHPRDVASATSSLYTSLSST